MTNKKLIELVITHIDFLNRKGNLTTLSNLFELLLKNPLNNQILVAFLSDEKNDKVEKFKSKGSDEQTVNSYIVYELINQIKSDLSFEDLTAIEEMFVMLLNKTLKDNKVLIKYFLPIVE